MATIVVDVNDGVPQTLDIKIPIGDAYRKLCTLQRDTGSAVAVNLTGVTYAMTISDHRGGTAELSLAATEDWTASGVHVDTAASGEFSIYILGSDCTDLETGKHWWELELTFPSDHAQFPNMVKTIYQGTCEICADAVNA